MADSPQKKVVGLEIGDTGTEILKGIISEEYNPKLRGTRGFETYDEMRKSDGTVKSAVLATTLPIRRARWFVQAASEDAADIEIADFVSQALFDWQTITWDDFLRQALLSLSFGVMLFEKVFEMRNENGRDYITWRKFAPRMPKSIQAWEMKNGENGVQQRTLKGEIVDIPIEKLIIFVNEKEGDNWEGTSMLRAAYKHWTIKNTFYKIDAIAFERQGLGIPYAKLPEAYTEADRAKAETILKNIRAHEHAFIIEPHDYEIGFKDMMAHTLRDPKESIAHHNREIVKSVLAQFLELGAGDTGSFALSKDQSGLFLHALEAIAKGFADVLNTYAVRELVDLNFDVKKYPYVTYTGIARDDVKKLAEAYQILSTAGAVKTGDNDEPFFRELLGLPERDMSEDDEETDEPNETPEEAINEDEVIEDIGLSEHINDIKKNIFPERKEIARAIQASIADLEDAHKLAFLKRSIAQFNQFSKTHKHHELFSTIKGELNATLASVRRRAFADGQTFKGYRPLTFAEKKVDFESLQKAMDKLEAEMDAATQDILHAEREKYMAVITKATLKGDTETIKQATFDIQKTYSKIIKDAMKKAYEHGKTNAAVEMGVKSPANTKKILDQIDLQSDAIAQQHIAQIVNEGTIKMQNALAKGASNTAALAAADAAMEALIDELTSNTSAITMAGYINQGRDTVFEENADKIYALQRSEILDANTCNYCLSVDGRVIEKDDLFGKNTIFHSGCRGIWVEILLEEEELPTIGGIPKSIRDRFGDDVNDLIQPKTPKTNKDSLARKEVEKRLKRQEKKEK